MKIKFNKKDMIYIPIIIVLIIAVAVLSVCLAVNMANNNVNDYYNQKCRSYSVQNANLSRGQIIFIGDSITDLCPLDDYYAELPLATYNRGIGGDTTQGVFDRLQVSLYDLVPSKIVLMIGINDINSGGSIDNIADNYKNILGDIKTNLPDTQVFCISVLPMNDKILGYASLNLAEQNAKVAELNETIKTLTANNGYTYVDLYSSVRAGGKLINDLTDDGIHLNAAGFTVWAQKIKPFLS